MKKKQSIFQLKKKKRKEESSFSEWFSDVSTVGNDCRVHRVID